MQRIFTALPLVLFFALSATPAIEQAKSGQSRPKSPGAKTAEALPPVDLPSEPGTYAVIYTNMGNIVCILYDKSAPKIVENFEGLARGTKAWKDYKTGRIHHTALYSGTTFHRVIPGFMIQGGDPAGDGTGEPGFKMSDEIDPQLNFAEKGVLAMANSGPNTNGSQFFITVAPAEHLNGNYSIFGKVVSGQDVADAISNVPRNEAIDKPLTPVTIKAILIRTVGPVPAGKKPAA